MDLRLGYKALSEQFDPAVLLGRGARAEECGFDSVFVSDHLRHDGGYAPLAVSVFHAPGRDHEKFVRLYGVEILPRLRAL